ncbi:MAG TPA: energy transducer TonB [Terriglobia bacterium]|nr:energy transducer TonB [Terriglobia bacterium]
MSIIRQVKLGRGLAALGILLMMALPLLARQQTAAAQNPPANAKSQPPASPATAASTSAAHNRIYIKPAKKTGAYRVDMARLCADIAKRGIALVKQPSEATLVLNVWRNAHGFLGVMTDPKGSILWTGAEATQAALERGIVRFALSPPEAQNKPAAPAASAARSSGGRNKAAPHPGKPLSASTLMNGRLHQVGGEKVTPPVLVYRPTPPYTKAARTRGLEGSVDLLILVDAKGDVTDVKEHGSPLGSGLDQSAINAVRTWKFKPAERAGVPVAVRIIVEVAFRLRHHQTMQND